MTQQSIEASVVPAAEPRPASGQVKHRLASRRRELVERVHAVGQDLGRVNDPASPDWAERAGQRANDEVLQAIGEADSHELAAIDAALRRLELGTYGLCTLCGTAIAAERLHALPHVEYCERCALVTDVKHRATR